MLSIRGSILQNKMKLWKRQVNMDARVCVSCFNEQVHLSFLANPPSSTTEPWLRNLQSIFRTLNCRECVHSDGLLTRMTISIGSPSSSTSSNPLTNSKLFLVHSPSLHLHLFLNTMFCCTFRQIGLSVSWY